MSANEHRGNTKYFRGEVRRVKRGRIRWTFIFYVSANEHRGNAKHFRGEVRRVARRGL